MGALLLVRHGQASWEASLAGEDYDVLSPTGWEQGRVLGRAWAGRAVRPGVVVRGSLRRHRETTQALLEGLGAPDLPVEIDTGWDEFDHVDVLAGMPNPRTVTDPDEGRALLEEALRAWVAGGASYAEDYDAFLARVLGAFERLHAMRGTVAVVTSGGVIAAITAHLLGAGTVDPAVWQRLNVVGVNTGVTTVVLGRRGATLVSFNEHVHVAGTDLMTYR